MKLRLALIALAAAASLALAGVALAHGSDPVRVEAAKHKNGPWKPTFMTGTVPEGQTKSFFMRITNTAHPRHKESISLRDGGYPYSGYDVSWFRGHTNITLSTQTGTYDFSLKHGETKKFKVRIHAIDASHMACVTGQFDIEPDAVTAFDVIRVNGHGACII